MKLMVVGDSISHGREGDWTWRYRLWEWLTSQGVEFEFVGPYTGTADAERPAPPPRPAVEGEAPNEPGQRITGGYAEGVDQKFDGKHFSMWGLQAHQVRTTIENAIHNYQPDFLLLELGFNDIGWGVSGPEGTLGSIETIVANARSAKPDLKFAIANMPQRTFVREDLPISTEQYNCMLKAAIPTWSTPTSPIALVQFCENYSSGPKGAPGAYDGLHPNSLGEYEIAQAFSETLNRFYGVGSVPLRLPKAIPLRPTPVPSNVSAHTSPGGVTVTWDAVYGAMGYDVKYRSRGDSNWDAALVQTNRYDTTLANDGQVFEYMIRTNNGEELKSEWSKIASAVAHPMVAAAPRDIGLQASEDGISVLWTRPSGLFSETVDLFQVIFHDNDMPGSWPGAKAVRSTSAHIRGLQHGHTYTFQVQSWNDAGGGPLSSGHSIKFSN